MRMRSQRRWLAILGIVAGLGCKPYEPPVVPVVPPFLEPDFSLFDTNPNSRTYAQKCSPRQQMGRISAWYFGHAT